jgi:formylglycine-generating enzyme required for sulfatase activity
MWGAALKVLGLFLEKVMDKLADIVGKRIDKRFDPAPMSESPLPTQPTGIVPQGLRSFNEQHADFFLQLIPGPRSKSGIPDSIQFWKTRIEQLDPEQTFRIGLIYGPSGCGKSSLVRAGLIPHLADHVIPVYVAATPDDTEKRFLAALKKHCPFLSPRNSLRAALGRREHVPAGRKVLLVLDQFEQFLHNNAAIAKQELAEAIAECDGKSIQCVVMVRDDFITPATAFVNQTGIRLSQNENCALVNRFGKRHARYVLELFGQAYGAFNPSGHPSAEHQAFLDQAISELADGEEVISVRLALFAKMMEHRDWTPAGFRAVGGTEGLGVRFLDETFSDSVYTPNRRYNVAAQKVLRSLLPESGSRIKGQMRSYAELLQASGYASEPGEFDVLIRLLGDELKLITPTNPEGTLTDADPTTLTGSAPRYYQLTHDYVVPSLEKWLTRKRRETRRGRAELRLAERSLDWNARPENRRLPALWEYVNIRLYTSRKSWTEPQRRMMHRARRVQGIRGIFYAACLAALTLLLIDQIGETLVITLQQFCDDPDRDDKATDQAGPVMKKIRRFPAWWADRIVERQLREAPDGTSGKLGLLLALSPENKNRALSILKELLNHTPANLSHMPRELTERLAQYDVQMKTQETNNGPAILFLTKILDDKHAYANESDQLAKELDTQRQRLDSDFESDPLKALTYVTARVDDVMPRLDYKHWKELHSQFTELRTKVRPKDLKSPLTQILGDIYEHKMERLAQRRASAAIRLLVLGTPADHSLVWPLLKQERDPRTRTYIIHWASKLGVDPTVLVSRIKQEREMAAQSDHSIHQALLLTLEGFSITRELDTLIKAGDPKSAYDDPGVYAAAEWLLHEAIDSDSGHSSNDATRIATQRERGWYVTTKSKQHHTMVVLKGATFEMGSDEWEPGRESDEKRGEVNIDHSFAIANKETTVGQYSAFTTDTEFSATFYFNFGGQSIKGYDNSPRSPVDRCPQLNVAWYEAAAYCNWLSSREKIPEEQWCYEILEGKYPDDLRTKEDLTKLGGYRLPTEVEWEFACRAGTRTRRYWGSADLLVGEYARSKESSLALKDSSLPVDDLHPTTQPVGQLRPNGFGLFDMQGNVAEWCDDYYRKDLSQVGKQLETEGLILPHVSRGGSWYHDYRATRSADRNRSHPRGSEVVGFRIARTMLGK